LEIFSGDKSYADFIDARSDALAETAERLIASGAV